MRRNVARAAPRCPAIARRSRPTVSPTADDSTPDDPPGRPRPSCGSRRRQWIPAAIGRARRQLITEQLRRWHCADPDDTALVVSELVTNAIIHAGGAVRVTVTRDGRARPHRRTRQRIGTTHLRASNTKPGGHGLHIVDQLSQPWGHIRPSTARSSGPSCPAPNDQKHPPLVERSDRPSIRDAAPGHQWHAMRPARALPANPRGRHRVSTRAFERRGTRSGMRDAHLVSAFRMGNARVSAAGQRPASRRRRSINAAAASPSGAHPAAPISAARPASVAGPPTRIGTATTRASSPTTSPAAARCSGSLTLTATATVARRSWLPPRRKRRGRWRPDRRRRSCGRAGCRPASPPGGRAGHPERSRRRRFPGAVRGEEPRADPPDQAGGDGRDCVLAAHADVAPLPPVTDLAQRRREKVEVQLATGCNRWRAPLDDVPRARLVAGEEASRQAFAQDGRSAPAGAGGRR